MDYLFMRDESPISVVFNADVFNPKEDVAAWASINPLRANLTIEGIDIPEVIKLIESENAKSSDKLTSYIDKNAVTETVVLETVAPKRNKNKEKRDRKKELARLEALRNAEEDALLLEQQRLNARTTQTNKNKSKPIDTKKASVSVPPSLTKSTKNFEEKRGEILEFVSEYIMKQLPHVVTKMETTDFSTIIKNTTGPESYTLALDYVVNELLIDLDQVIMDKLEILLNKKEQLEIKKKNLLIKKKNEIKNLINHAILEQRKFFINSPELNASEIVDDIIKEKIVPSQDVEKIEKKYRDLCIEYMGSEKTCPKFPNIYFMQLAFEQYVDHLVVMRDSNSQKTHGGGGAK